MKRPASFRIVSGDGPGTVPLAALVACIVTGLLLTPWIFPGARSMDIAAKILVFALLAASFDLLIGYTGIVSFSHTVFFGIGGYGVSIAVTRLGVSWASIVLGVACAVCLSAILSAAMGLFSLRLKAIFFAMTTFAVAAAFQTLASQMHWLTGGEDGMSFTLPAALAQGTVLFDIPPIGKAFTGRHLTFYLIFAISAGLFLLLLRVVNSPFGAVLRAVRENEFRASAVGFSVTRYRVAATVIGSCTACIAGTLMAIWVKFNGPTTTLSVEIMLDILLIVVIGGMGTIWGALIGATVLLLAHGYLHDLLQLVHTSFAGHPSRAIFSPDRWLAWLGILFILSVYYFPEGVVGRMRIWAMTRKLRHASAANPEMKSLSTLT